MHFDGGAEEHPVQLHAVLQHVQIVAGRSGTRLEFSRKLGPVHQLLAVEKETAGPASDDQVRHTGLLSRRFNIFRARQQIGMDVRIVPVRVEGAQHHVVAGQLLGQGPT